MIIQKTSVVALRERVVIQSATIKLSLIIFNRVRLVEAKLLSYRFYFFVFLDK